MTKKALITTLLAILLLGTFTILSAAMFQSVPAAKTTLVQKGPEKKFCPVCGMNLAMFYKTNYSASVNGKEKQYCSLHCLVEDMEQNHKELKNIKVVDTDSLKFIDAKKAYYVVGSSKKGTMSMVSKYAFATLSAASKFAAKFGGVVTDFNGAIETAKKDFPKDTSMIHMKQSKMAHMGSMIYTKKCKQENKHFSSVAAAKAYVVSNNICSNLSPKELQAVGLYLSK